MWLRLVVTVCSCLLGLSGCVSKSPLAEKIWAARSKPSAVESQRLELQGRVTLEVLRDLLWASYRIELSLPLDVADREVLLPGQVTRGELVAWLERTAECEVITVGDYWSLVCEGGQFAVLIPPVSFESIAGVQIENIGGRALATGPYAELPRLRRLLQLLERPRDVVRLRLFLLDESKATALGVSMGSPFKVSYEGGLFGHNWSGDLVMSAFREGGCVVSEFEGLVTAGEEFLYTDQVEQRFEQFVASGDTGQTFASQFATIAAGLNVVLRAVRLADVWRLEGDVELSDFRVSGSQVPNRVTRKVSVHVDAVEGSIMRLATVRVDRRGYGGGVRANVGSASWDKSGSTFGIWLVVEMVRLEESSWEGEGIVKVPG